MQNKFTKLICAAAVACGSWFLAGCVTRPVVNGVPNFAEVEAGIYRWSIPGLAAFWKSVTPIKREDESK